MAGKPERVAVPFAAVVWTGENARDRVASIRTGAATGVHAGSGRVLLRWDDTGKVGTYAGHRALAMPLDSAQCDEYLHLLTACYQAKRAVRDYEAATGIQEIDLYEAVQQAQKQDQGPGPYPSHRAPTARSLACSAGCHW